MLELRSRFRKKHQVSGTDVKSIRYRPPAIRRRKAVAWIVGVGVSAVITASFLSQGGGELMGVFSLLYGPLIGIPTGMTAGQADQVTVQIDHRAP